MALGIPLPGSYGDALSKGLATGSDVMQRMMMNPYDMALKQAQAENERAQASKSSMLANLIQSAFGGGGGVGGTSGNEGGAGTAGTTGTTGTSGAPSGANQRAMVGWLLGLGEYPADKRAGELGQKKGEIDLKKQQDVLDSAYVLRNSYQQATRLQKLFQQRPDLTGPVQGALYSLHLSTDKDLGKAVADFGKIQASLARSATARPGIGAINWAAKVKANESDPMNINVGKVDETVSDMREEYETYKRQYKNATGQDMPSFEEFMGESQQGGAQQQPGSQPVNQPVNMNTGQQPEVPQGTPQTGKPQIGNPEQRSPVEKALSIMPPRMRKDAIDAIKQGADPIAVVNEALQVLKQQQGQPGAQ